MRLYDLVVSGNCHKIRLMLGLLSLDYTLHSLQREDTLSQSFRAINPRGQVPVLEDAGEIVWDSMAILAYLARRYGGPRWLPEEPIALAHVMQWLAVSENEILYGLARARAVLKMGRPFNLGECQQMGRQALNVMETRLDGRDWLASEGHPTIADVACYPYVALAPEGDIPLEAYPTIRAWLGRVQHLPGYVGMPGIAAY